MTGTPVKKDKKTNLYKLLLDVALAIAFILSMEPRYTGVTLHEWLSIGMVVAITLHLLLNWGWIVRVTRHFFKKLNGRTRLYAFLNIGLLIAGEAVVISGIAISRVFDTAIRLGLSPETALFWRDVHHVSADILLILIALHIGLHWNWITCMVKAYLGKRRARVAGRAQCPTEAPLAANGVGK